MRHTFSLETKQIEDNIAKLSSYLRENSIDAAYVSSFDIFMNEYVPMQECHRYYVTGFSGSVAEALVLASGKCLVFVDGRYHEQVDIEVEAKNVEAVKCPFGEVLFDSLCKKVEELKVSKILINGDRSSLKSLSKFKKVAKEVSVSNDDLFSKFLELSEFSKDAVLEEISELESSNLKVDKILKEGEAFWVTALDSISWVTNLRGYGLPFQSSFMARCLVKKSKIELAIPENYSVADVDTFIDISKTNLKSFSSKVDLTGIERVFYDPDLINVTDFIKLEESLGADKLCPKNLGIIGIHAVKSSDEMKKIDDAFNRGDRAISNTINWAKTSFDKGESFSELDVFHKTTEFYEEQGSKSQSFGTISGIGPNSSIIHYSSPSAEVMATEGELLLLDSGGFFEGGFATDTTRTIFLGKGKPSEKQKLIYTLVLKGVLQAQNAIFPEGTWGSHIDALARNPILSAGFNYAHGTGHGVGINVHEGGLRFSPTSSIPIKKGNVGSIEPGIYLPGFGGVRLENIVTVEEHPEHKGLLHFRPLVYIGYDHSLINFELLESSEKKWLSDYELECEKRGTLYPST